MRTTSLTHITNVDRTIKALDEWFIAPACNVDEISRRVTKGTVHDMSIRIGVCKTKNWKVLLNFKCSYIYSPTTFQG